MRGEIPTENQDVVLIKEKKGKITQHLMLEGVAGLSQTKRHAEEFVHPKGGDDGGLLDVLRSRRNLIITFLKVELREDCGPVILEVKLVIFGRG